MEITSMSFCCTENVIADLPRLSWLEGTEKLAWTRMDSRVSALSLEVESLPTPQQQQVPALGALEYKPFTQVPR